MYNVFLNVLQTASPLCVIPIEDILAVEAVQESSFRVKNMFQVVQPNRTLYIQVNITLHFRFI